MFKSLGKAIIGTVLLPVDVVVDVVTLGGAVTDNESAIANRLSNIGENLKNATDPNKD